MLGKKLKEIRASLKLSQEEFSIKTGVTYRAYTSYERGDRKPSFEFLETLASSFDVNLNWLIANKGEPFEQNPNQTDLKVFKKEIIDEMYKILKEKGL